jgi:hypothetical protein
MKAIKLVLCLMIPVMIGCKKDGGSQEEDKNNKNLADIVPQAYLNKLKEMGFTVFTGNNPPDVSGEYLLAPWRYDGDNYNAPGVGTAPGSVNQDGFKLRLSEQNGTSLVVRYIGYYEGTKELSKPFITGSGNDFTICRHVLMVGGMGALFTFPYVQLISGTKDGKVLRNVKMATIGLKAETPNEAGITVEGQISIRSDVDGVSQ